MKLPPRTNWNISDNKLKPIPPLYPPLISNCCTFIGDSSPSIIATRIAECLKKRSILAEYDDEAATATAYTADHVVFMIHLYKGDKGPKVELDINELSRNKATDLQQNISAGTSGESVTYARPNFSQGVIVECQRIRGCTMSFHRHIHSALSSARGEASGVEDSKSKFALMKQSPFLMLDYSLSKCDPNETCILPNLLEMPTEGSKIPQHTCEVLERVLGMLQSDKVDVQLVGIKTLVLLTDIRTSRLESAYLSSLCVLGSPMKFSSQRKMSVSNRSEPLSIGRIHDKILSFVEGSSPVDLDNSRSSYDENQRIQTTLSNSLHSFGEYTTQIYTHSMTVLANSLRMVVHHSQKFPLLPLPSPEPYLTKSFIERIASDLVGAVRPPSASMGSAHEAVISARILHLLATYTHGRFSNRLYNSKSGNRSIIELLEVAKMVGVSNHYLLKIETAAALQIKL